MTHTWPLSAVLACIALPCAGATELVQVLRIEGVCKTLVASGMDGSPSCAGHLTYTLRSDGRSEFRYEAPGIKWRDQPVAVSFSGQGLAETHPSRGVTALPVDAVTVVGGGPSLPATGECRYGDPFAGAATIRCVATANGARYEGEFESSGARPLAIRK